MERRRSFYKEVIRDVINILATVALIGGLSLLVHHNIDGLKEQNERLLVKLENIEKTCQKYAPIKN